jgi:hypothetical protein
MSSFSVVDFERQDYFDMAKKGTTIIKKNRLIKFVILVFDNLNNLYKRLSMIALEKHQKLVNKYLFIYVE